MLSSTTTGYQNKFVAVFDDFLQKLTLSIIFIAILAVLTIIAVFSNGTNLLCGCLIGRRSKGCFYLINNNFRNKCLKNPYHFQVQKG